MLLNYMIICLVKMYLYMKSLMLHRLMGCISPIDVKIRNDMETFKRNPYVSWWMEARVKVLKAVANKRIPKEFVQSLYLEGRSLK